MTNINIASPGAAQSSLAAAFAGLTPRIALSLPNVPLMAGAIGDSNVRNQYSYNTSNLSDFGVAYKFTGRAWVAWLCQLSGRRVWPNVYAFEGYSGYRSEQVFGAMLPSTYTVPIGSAYDATIPYGVLAVQPHICFDLTGTNNIGAGTTMETMLQGKHAVWTRLSKRGILPISVDLMPRSSPAINASIVPAWNAAIKAMAAEWGIPHLSLYDYVAASPGGGWKAGYTYINGADDPSGLHPGNEACQALAYYGWQQLAPQLGLGATTPTLYSGEAANHLNTTASGSQAVASAAIQAGGTGYVVGDTVTLANNNLQSPQTAAVLRVDTVSSGVITAVSVVIPGIYPAGSSTSAIAQATTQKLGTPAPGAGSGATFNLTFTSSLLDTSRNGDNLVSWDTGLFPATTGWTPRFNPNTSITASVAADALAQYGNALIYAMTAPGSSTNYADLNGPGTLTVAAGQKWAYFGRLQFDAGSVTDEIIAGLQASGSAGALIWSFANGGGVGSTCASTIAGASMAARDWYTEVVIPVGVTSIRPWVQLRTSPGLGATMKIAQVGAARIA